MLLLKNHIYDDYDNYVAWGKMNQMMKACDVPKEDIDNLRRIMLEAQ